MTEQLTLGEQMRDDGTAAVLASVDTDWLTTAHLVVDAFIDQRVQFTADEVTYYAGMPDKPNAVGALFRSYAADGRIRRVGWATATRPSRRAAALAVWQAP